MMRSSLKPVLRLAALAAAAVGSVWAAERAADLIEARGRVAVLEAEKAQLQTDAGILLANIDWFMEHCDGELCSEDVALIEQVRAALADLAAPAQEGEG
jgi:hypothetical protein